MKAALLWGDNVVDKNGAKQTIYDLAFSPDGALLLVACSDLVLVYDAVAGSLRNTIRTHKEPVYAVSFSADGKRFASGGADKTVIIWDASNMESIIKYTHSDSVQCLAHNPVTGQATSGSYTDYGLWSPEQKSVTKYKTGSRVVCCSWTADGQILALGCFNGQVILRSLGGEELVKIDRGQAPVWALSWNESIANPVLAIADWSQRMVFYDCKGRQFNEERNLKYDPCTVEFLSGGDLVAVGGSDHKVTIWTVDGVKVGTICERDSWIWKCAAHPRHNQIALGTNSGTVAVYQMTFNTVHGMYQDLYASREKMTTVVIQRLARDEKLVIKCTDYVRKIAIYKGVFAVQFPEYINIYELIDAVESSDNGLSYSLKQTIPKRFDCNLLVVTSQHIVLCLDKRLQLLTFDGEVEREWTLPALIRYIKTFGGSPGNEGLLVGLKNGEIYFVYIHNPFPIHCFSIKSVCRCLDISVDKQKIAAVDDAGMCTVYYLSQKRILFQEPGASSVAWNVEHKDMLCYSGNGFLNIKAGLLPAHQQRLSGFVVGFKGSKVFCLSSNVMFSVNVPQSASLLLYLDQGHLQKAYEVGCLGVTDSDWKRLAVNALEKLDLTIAKKAFVRLRDYRYLDLIRTLDYIVKDGDVKSQDLALAEIQAYQGNYEQAAVLFKRSGHLEKAVQMFTDLQMWDLATKYTGEQESAEKTDVLKKKARTQQDKMDLLSAAETYIEIKDYQQAIALYAQNKSFDKLIELVRLLPKTETKALTKCSDLFVAGNHLDFAVETLTKQRRFLDLAKLYMGLGRWDDIHELVQSQPELAEFTYLPYANHSLQQGKITEALSYYRKAQKFEFAVEVLLRMAEHAVTENRFSDASGILWKISMEYRSLLPDDAPADFLSEDQKKYLASFYDLQIIAEYLHAFAPLHSFITQPFTDYRMDSLFNMARFLFHAHVDDRKSHQYSGLACSINYCTIIFALGKLCKHLGATKSACFIFEKSKIYSPSSLQMRKQMEMDWLIAKSSPSLDAEDLHPVCWSCGATNPILNLNSSSSEFHYRSQCQECGIFAIKSGYSFEDLGIIEFRPEEGISPSDALDCIMAEPLVSVSVESTDATVQTFTVDTDEVDLMDVKNITIRDGIEILTREQLQHLVPDQVFIHESKKACLATRYYRKALPEIVVTSCPHCLKFFETEDFELQVAKHSKCPFCQIPS
eukprot:Partr_v1_DN28634_c0_g2_i3_m49606 putative Intraflagellar transport 122 homolog (Chlamydomonas)